MNTYRRTVACAMLFLALCHVDFAMAEKLRPANAAEESAINRYNSVMTHLLDQFLTDDWEENEGERYTFDGVLVNSESDRPLDVNCLLERTYTVRTNSERFNKLLAPLIQKLEQESTPSGKQEIGRQLQALMHLKVSVHFNRTNVSLDPGPKPDTDLGISGIDRTYKTNDTSQGEGSAYVLLFGNWQSAKWMATDGWLHFSFVHPNRTPFIENIEIRLYGADDRIQELLHSIDWKQVNEAMTR